MLTKINDPRLQWYAKYLVLVLTIIYGNLIAQNTLKPLNDVLTVNVDINDADGVLYHERTIQSYVNLKNNSTDTVTADILWQFSTDDWRLLKQVSIPAKTKGNENLRSYSPLFSFSGPGFYRVAVTVRIQNEVAYQASKVIGIDPEKIPSVVNPPEDLDAFWEASLKNLSSIDPQFKVIPQERKSNVRTNLFKVEMQSFGGATVRGWLEVPKEKGVYPALLRVPGFSGTMEPIDKYDDMVVFSFNPRNHGESDDTFVRDYTMWVQGMESKETYFYRGLFLDCIRAVDFLMDRADVDKDRIAIWGGSQGGGLSFATAALDHRIALCIADIPFICDWSKYFEITHWDEMDAWFDAHPKQTWQSALETLSYFDTKNLAEKIECPVIMGIGLQDDVCPPATSFATYNHIKAPKAYTIYKEEGHNQPESHYEDRFLRLRKLFKMK